MELVGFVLLIEFKAFFQWVCGFKAIEKKLYFNWFACYFCKSIEIKDSVFFFVEKYYSPVASRPII
jgi:hypothetical protein